MSGSNNKEVVLVTGACGFVALHAVDLLLKEGYKVRGTVRDLNNEPKLEPLRAIGANYEKDQLEVVETDLIKDIGWAEAVRGCDFVVHLACPFPNTEPENLNDVFIPTIEGTKRVLKYCSEEVLRNNKKLKRVVMTSNVVTVHGETDETKKVFSEKDWTDVNTIGIDFITKSKTLAERGAWNFVNSLPAESKFELTVINPGMMLGPLLKNEYGTSLDILVRAFTTHLPYSPKLHFFFGDVRDLALAIQRAMVIPEAAGNRFLVGTDHRWLHEMARFLNTEFQKYGYNLPTKESAYIAALSYSLIDKSLKLLMPRYGKSWIFDNSRMKNILGVKPRPLDETILVTAHSLIEKGIIKKTKSYVPPTKN